MVWSRPHSSWVGDVKSRGLGGFDKEGLIEQESMNVKHEIDNL
jgi:hypothetical protein